jgi:hypothetical protein
MVGKGIILTFSFQKRENGRTGVLPLSPDIQNLLGKTPLGFGT